MLSSDINHSLGFNSKIAAKLFSIVNFLSVKLVKIDKIVSYLGTLKRLRRENFED